MKFTGTLREPEKMTAQFSALKLPLSGGYEEGYADGHTAGYTEGEQAAKAKADAANAIILTDCNAVLPDKGVEAADSLEQVPQRIGEIQITEDLLRYCNSVCIAGLGVFDKEEVVFNLDLASGLGRMLYSNNASYPYRNTKVKHLIINCAQQITGTQQALLTSDYVLERITLNADISKSNSTMQMFRDQVALKVIDGTPLDLSSSTNNANMIQGTTSLEEIRFAPNSIKASIGLQGSANLSDTTIQSIVDGLADLIGQTAQTLTIHAAVGAKLTEAQKATITAKNWTLVY